MDNNYSKKMLIKEMKQTYKTHYYDWLCFEITSQNPLTFHHLVKDADGGKLTLENGALLSNNAHQFINQLEAIDINYYNFINDKLKKVNNAKAKITYELQLEIIKAVKVVLTKYNNKIKFGKKLYKEYCELELKILKQYLLSILKNRIETLNDKDIKYKLEKEVKKINKSSESRKNKIHKLIKVNNYIKFVDSNLLTTKNKVYKKVG